MSSVANQTTALWRKFYDESDYYKQFVLDRALRRVKPPPNERGDVPRSFNLLQWLTLSLGEISS